VCIHFSLRTRHRNKLLILHLSALHSPNERLIGESCTSTSFIFKPTLRNFQECSTNAYPVLFLIRLVRGGVELGPLGVAATDRPIVPASGDYDDEEFGGMMMGRGNRSTRRKPAPAPLSPPRIPLDQTRDRTRAGAVGSQRLMETKLKVIKFLKNRSSCRTHEYDC
jgi:hypothetical protein